MRRIVHTHHFLRVQLTLPGADPQILTATNLEGDELPEGSVEASAASADADDDDERESAGGQDSDGDRSDRNRRPAHDAERTEHAYPQRSDVMRPPVPGA